MLKLNEKVYYIYYNVTKTSNFIELIQSLLNERFVFKNKLRELT